MKKYVVLLVVLTLLFIYGYFIGIKHIQASVSHNDAKNYIEKMYSDYTLIGENCQGEDTDNDSYVSCDLRLKNTAGNEKILHLQCPIITKSLTGTVCKEYRAIIQQ